MPTRRTKSATAAEASITDLMQAIGVLIKRVRAESGTDAMSWSQSSAMARLEQNGPTTTAELARAEMVKPQSMGTLLAELEQEGLVQRQPHPTDGRQILFSLTDQGEEARRKRHAAKIAWLTTAMNQFDADERRTLVDAIALIKRLGEG